MNGLGKKAAVGMVFIGECRSGLRSMDEKQIDLMLKTLGHLVQRLLGENVQLNDNYIWFPFYKWSDNVYPAGLIEEIGANGFDKHHLTGKKGFLFNEINKALVKRGLIMDCYDPVCYLFPPTSPFVGLFLICFKKMISSGHLLA